MIYTADMPELPDTLLYISAILWCFHWCSVGRGKKEIIGMIKQANNIMYEAKRKYHLMQNETVE